MKTKLVAALAAMAGALAALTATAAAAAEVDLQACYAKAKTPDAQKACLDAEWKSVQAEHKDAVERVASLAKAWDKPYRTRERWTQFIRSGQSFETWVSRECRFIKKTTKGNRTQEDIAELACKINLYRVRLDMLENHYLSAAR